ncbi:hypothetical protein CBOM_07514 [Ceraceosorus bombacis]|uniref:Uncharacterized protein n=1 Tax=Ceraceosorus bombacis TaxID=401625 RepID=A0A0P1BEF1_9BASI|nr:hypothetical protein CBOM_07514 [Ceraceosorus bombacis]
MRTRQIAPATLDRNLYFPTHSPLRHAASSSFTAPRFPTITFRRGIASSKHNSSRSPAINSRRRSNRF